MSGTEPSTTQSTGDLASHDDVINTVSGSRVTTSLRKATSDAYPAGGGWARTRDDQQSPTSGSRRGRGASKPVAITHSAPEAAAVAEGSTAASSRPVNPQPPVGDHPRRSDSDEHLNREDSGKTKKQTTSSWTRSFAGDSRDCADKTSNSVVVLKTLTATAPSDSTPSYGQAADGARTADGTSGTGSTDSQEQPRGVEATSNYSRQRCAGHDIPASRKVKSEGQQLQTIFLSN